MAYSTARDGTVVIENAVPMMRNLSRLDIQTLTFFPAAKDRFRQVRLQACGF